MLRQLRTNLSSSILLLACLITGANELQPLYWAAWVSGPALLVFFALEWKRLAGVARLLISGALLLLIIFSAQDGVSLEILSKSINRGAFLAVFVTVLNILKDSAQSSRLIRECGAVIVNQPPGRRYTMLTLGGHLFGVLLNLGTLSLLGTMIRRTIDTSQKNVEPRIREIRLQRMTLAILRGFAAVPLWAPTSITIVIVLSGMPELSWFDLLPFGLSGAVLFIATGWAVDRLSFPRAKRIEKRYTLKQIFLTLLPLFILVVILPGIAFGVAQFLSVRLTSAMLICIPIFGLCWIFIQYLRRGAIRAFFLTTRRMHRRLLPSFSELRSEIGIFYCSGFLSILLLSQIDIGALGNMIVANGLNEGWTLVLFSWVIIIASVAGINPIITMTLSMEILQQLPGMNIQLTMIALMVTMTWAIAVNLAPIGASIRLISYCIQKPPSEIAFHWNAVFSLVMLSLLSVFLLIFG